MLPYVFVRQCLLLALLTLLSSAVGLGLLQTPVRASGLLDAAIEHGRVTTLVTFETAVDADFHQIPLEQRALVVSEHRIRLMQDIGFDEAPTRSFRFSRGVLLKLSPRQIRRLSRQRGVWQIEFNQGVAYESDPQAERLSADLSIEPIESQAMSFDASVKIAVIDTGLERLDGAENVAVIDQACFCSRDGGCCPAGSLAQNGRGAVRDEHGHGTAVADIAMRTARRHAPGRNLGLIAVKILDDYPGICCPSDVAAAFDWLAAAHPDLDVANASLNVGPRYGGYCDDGWGASRLIADAVSAVQYNGTSVVGASGNEGSLAGMSAPACVSGVTSVGAVYKQDYAPEKKPDWGCIDVIQNRNQVTCFSNSGEALDLLAPGAYLTAPWLNGTVRDERLRGTSFAAPQVAGCTAAMRALAPELDAASVRDLLTDTGTPIIDHRSGEAWPLLDCSRAVDALMATRAGERPASPDEI
jgi:hypothetical protein